MASFGELLGAEIFKARSALGWTQRHVVSRAFPPGEGSVRQFRRHEKHESDNPQPKSYMPICGALGIPPQKIFELAILADNLEFVDLSHLEETDELCPKRLATRVQEDADSELAARRLHFLIILKRSASAKSELEALMADATLPLSSLDYCFRYYHFAFRSKLNVEMHRSAIAYLGDLLRNDNFDIADKSAFSIGEFYLYNPHPDVKNIAKGILFNSDGYPDHVRGLLDYTKRRVGL